MIGHQLAVEQDGESWGFQSRRFGDALVFRMPGPFDSTERVGETMSALAAWTRGF